MSLGGDLLAEVFRGLVLNGIGSHDEAERKEDDFHCCDVEIAITNKNRLQERKKEWPGKSGKKRKLAWTGWLISR